MLIDCPVCAKTYHVGRADLDGGRTLICPRCDASWFADENGVAAPTIPHGPARHATATFSYSRQGPSAFLSMMRTAVGVGACFAILMMAIGARDQIVRAVPRAAAIYALAGLKVNTRHLEFVNVAPSRPGSDPSRIVMSGAIRNLAAQSMRVPYLVYDVLDVDERPLASWTERAPARSVDVGALLAFSSSLHVLPEGTRSVRVRFEDHRDDTIVAFAPALVR